MSKLITPIFLILLSVGLFVFFTNPTYLRSKELKETSASYNQVLDKSKELIALRESLLTTYNNFSASDVERLKKMLPDHVDNVRLIIEIDAIALQYGMTVRDASVAVQENTTQGDDTESIFEIQQDDKQKMQLSFSVVAPYNSFISFLKDLEKNLRIVDIESVSFTASEKDLYEYEIVITTYWLNPTL